MMEASKQASLDSGLEDPADDRRQFMKTAAKFAGVLAALGLSQEAVMGTAAERRQREPAAGTAGFRERTVKLTAREQALGSVVQDAIRSKSMSAAIERSPAKAELTAADRAALNSLDQRDLEALGRIEQKLRGKIGDAAHGFGIF
jgi:hypothetical protein